MLSFGIWNGMVRKIEWLLTKQSRLLLLQTQGPFGPDISGDYKVNTKASSQHELFRTIICRYLCCRAPFT